MPRHGLQETGLSKEIRGNQGNTRETGREHGGDSQESDRLSPTLAEHRKRDKIMRRTSTNQNQELSDHDVLEILLQNAGLPSHDTMVTNWHSYDQNKQNHFRYIEQLKKSEKLQEVFLIKSDRYSLLQAMGFPTPDKLRQREWDGWSQANKDKYTHIMRSSELERQNLRGEISMRNTLLEDEDCPELDKLESLWDSMSEGSQASASTIISFDVEDLPAKIDSINRQKNRLLRDLGLPLVGLPIQADVSEYAYKEQESYSEIILMKRVEREKRFKIQDDEYDMLLEDAGLASYDSMVRNWINQDERSQQICREIRDLDKSQRQERFDRIERERNELLEDENLPPYNEMTDNLDSYDEIQQKIYTDISKLNSAGRSDRLTIINNEKRQLLADEGLPSFEEMASNWDNYDEYTQDACWHITGLKRQERQRMLHAMHIEQDRLLEIYGLPSRDEMASNWNDYDESTKATYIHTTGLSRARRRQALEDASNY